MTSTDAIISEMTDRLATAAGDDLVSVVLYGARVHGDYTHDQEHVHLLIVLRDLELEQVAAIAGPVRWWLGKKKPYPRIMSPRIIREAADVFPIEFLDITRHHRVLHGDDPFTELDVHKDHLRLQCERELRENLMRLQEGYIAAADKDRKLRRLLIESYLTFAQIFRGCLHLDGGDVPVATIEAIRAFCERAELDAEPFEQVHRQYAREADIERPAETFANYYTQVRRAVGAIDSFSTQQSQGDAV
jgi:predicted nucleotidyltransferase